MPTPDNQVWRMVRYAFMSAQAITKSQAKLLSFAATRERDRLARQIMEREGCSFSEAYVRILDNQK